MTTDKKKPFTVYEMNEEGTKLKELGEIAPFDFFLHKTCEKNSNGELNSKSFKEVVIAITKLAAEFEDKNTTASFIKALDAIPTQSAFKGEDPTKLETFDEWKHLESNKYVHSFWNNPFNYQIDFIFRNKHQRRQIEKCQAKAQSYLERNSAFFSSFGREDAKMKTDLFDMKSFISGDKRIVEFTPKKMKVFHTTIWGADILSDVEIDTTNQAVMRQLVDIKVQIDRWNMITGFFIISEGTASAYPIIEYQKAFRSKMKDIGAAATDRVTASFYP